MYAVRPVPVSRYNESRRICRSYMAEFTNQSSPPTSCKAGFYAILMVDTGMVWMDETSSFKTLLTRVRSKNPIAGAVDAARERGSALEVYLLTKPHIFSAQKMEDELWQNDLLAFRKTRDLQAPGKLYVVRHDRTHDYFIVSDRNDCPPSTIKNSFLSRLQRESANSKNRLLAEFITNQADDILRHGGFSIHLIGAFKDREDEAVNRQKYINQCTYGRNLNWQSVENI